MHTSEISFKDLSITHVHKKTLKNSYISVTSEAKVILKTSSKSKIYINDLLRKKESWIRKQLLKQKQNRPIEINLEDEVLLFGEVYSVDTKDAEILRNSLCNLRKPTRENILRCYDNFYKEHAKSYLTKRVEHYSSIMNLKYQELKFKKMKSRWGSCNSLGVITLNTNLLKLRKEQIDYVVVHELSHLVHMNHSKAFHALVETYFTDSLRVRKDIRERRLYSMDALK
ncbi:hypothetical protein M947_00545 [Sulfurimonas hongkongensis]|uniref:YgjP-like metallopeptidase domain-containing protein n=1 Tax=Sulfurimonas hongkongensis TaxID=1172190 RepID=T0L399_9BACT|nr:hypothetical protein M947_00545 [Sulfurimonas hongkongensis]